MQNIKDLISNLEESSIHAYVDEMLEKTLRKSGIPFDLEKKVGYTSFSTQKGYKIVNNGVGIKVYQKKEEIAYFDRPRLDYKKAIDLVEGIAEVVAEAYKTDAEKLVTWAKKNLKFSELEYEPNNKPGEGDKLWVHSVDENSEPAGYFINSGTTFQWHPIWAVGKSRGSGFQTNDMKKYLKTLDKDIKQSMENYGYFDE